MTNTILLNNKINSSGMTKQFIADKLGITYQALLNKLDGKSEFKAGEINSLGKALHFDMEDVHDIFFAEM